MKHILISESNKNIGDFNTLVLTALMETISKKNAIFSLYKCSKITFEGSLSFLVTLSVVLVNTIIGSCGAGEEYDVALEICVACGIGF